jgi:1-phosphofructokinase family hexose kinase
MILAAGLTPAWQQILAFDQFAVGEVNRAREAHWCASGKVANVGIALTHLGGPARTVCAVGGSSGQAIRSDLNRMGVSTRAIEVAAPTRVCTTILDGSTGRTTELVENAAPISAAELEAFRTAWSEESRGATHAVLCGSLPAGTPADFYARLMSAGSPATQYVLDCRGAELLASLPLRPLVVKPNLEELGRTATAPLTTEAAIWSAMRGLNERGAAWVVISQGGGPLRVSSSTLRYIVTPPRADVVVNPIGCGDSLAAGIAWRLREGGDVIDAIRFGVAAAFDNLGQLLPARLDLDRVRQIAARVGVERVGA